jgi:hypothetical protein
MAALSDEELADVADFLSKRPMAMPYAVGVASPLAWTAWRGASVARPMTFLIGADGRVLWTGFPTRLRPRLDRALAGTWDAALETRVAKYEDEIEAWFQTEKAQGGLSPEDMRKAIASTVGLLALQPDHVTALSARLQLARAVPDRDEFAAAIAAIPTGIPPFELDDLISELLGPMDPAWRAPEVAVRLAKAGVTADPRAESIDLWSRVLARVGLVPQALVEQDRAIALAEKAGEPVGLMKAQRAALERTLAAQALAKP